MIRKIIILSMILSLCAASVQAQFVDSTHTSATADSMVITPKNTQSQAAWRKAVTDSSAKNASLQTMDVSPDSVPPAVNVRLREGHRGKGIKISSDKPVEQVSVSDSVLRKKHNPKVAGCLSIIPGAGQIYNKKYWKLPIVYGALGISSYFVYDFAHNMVMYKKEFINRRDGNTALLRPEFSLETDANILEEKNTYRRRMEIAIAVTAALYFLNIIDAVVDAHLYYFDISDDLSLRVSPQINQNYCNSLAPRQGKMSFNYGVSLTLNLK